MAVTININNLSLCHKGSNGISTATIPDVCKTPSPGGPVPIPYPNIAMSMDLMKGTTTVKADGGMMCANYGSEFFKSTGDEPGVVGGVASSTFIKEATWITFSFDVKFQGKAACRLTDKMFHNHQNTVNLGGLLQAFLSLFQSDLKSTLLECDDAKAVYNKAKAANGGKDPVIKMQPSAIKSGGSFDPSTGTISIDKVDSAGKKYDRCTQIETLCFELGNLSRKAEFDAAAKTVKTAKRETFIRSIEKIEYDTAKETVSVTDACKKKWGCPKMKSDLEWAKKPKNFDEYYKIVRNDHKELYGKYWDSLNPTK